MANSGDDVLKQAHAFIKAGDKKSATKLLKQVLQKDKDNAGAWWLLANAVDNPTHQEKALEQVLRLRPGEKKAQQMLTRLQIGESIAPSDVLGRESTPVAPLKRTPEKPVTKASFTEDPFSDDYDYGDPFTDDPFADDPFADDPFTDDPFVDVGRPARASAQNNRYDSSAFSDDPFGGKNPFAADGFPSRSFQSAPAGQPSKSAPKSSSRSSNPFILAGVATAVIIVIAAVALVVIGSNESTSSAPISGNCDIGITRHASLTTVTCGQISSATRWTGHLNGNEQHDWTFNASAGQEVTINLQSRTRDFNSDDFVDTVLELVNPQNITLARHDDIDVNENDLNSRITMTMPEAGNYTIRVSDYAGDGGNYEIRIDSASGASAAQVNTSSSNNCDVGVIDRSAIVNPTRVTCATIERGSVVRGRLNTNEEHAWTFQGRGGESYTITLTGINGGDMYLELYNQAGARIAENDDIDIDNGDFNSRLIVTLTGSEQYTIVARTYSGVTSEAYELRLEG